MAKRDELAAIVARRRTRTSFLERNRILEEFASVTGLRSKRTRRLLGGGQPGRASPVDQTRLAQLAHEARRTMVQHVAMQSGSSSMRRL